ncbi:hypothetical protein [Gilvimarinus algae]|uniref:Uncharacterized protein n=1 Tax=Gilvimarinus algae TaxID=3058037 RepID=A0ABT8TBE2_9GAMM|nr:hypothetical protein [Gilvimarinus sp. SDUM040014]MDO3380904.1 hypothetical protein [Gilvimarinus sp. SDUM040014]
MKTNLYYLAIAVAMAMSLLVSTDANANSDSKHLEPALPEGNWVGEIGRPHGQDHYDNLRPNWRGSLQFFTLTNGYFQFYEQDREGRILMFYGGHLESATNNEAVLIVDFFYPDARPELRYAKHNQLISISPENMVGSKMILSFERKGDLLLLQGDWFPTDWKEGARMLWLDEGYRDLPFGLTTEEIYFLDDRFIGDQNANN